MILVKRRKSSKTNEIMLHFKPNYLYVLASLEQIRFPGNSNIRMCYYWFIVYTEKNKSLRKMLKWKT